MMCVKCYVRYQIYFIHSIGCFFFYVAVVLARLFRAAVRFSASTAASRTWAVASALRLPDAWDDCCKDVFSGSRSGLPGGVIKSMTSAIVEI